MMMLKKSIHDLPGFRRFLYDWRIRSRKGIVSISDHEQLAAAGHSINDPEIVAVTGWTTEDLLNAVSKIDPERNMIWLPC